MSLEIYLLGVLRGAPMHGYELRRRVQRPTLRPLSNNSLYPALRRFEADGVVTRTVETSEGRPPRHVYALTECGRAHFHELVATLPPELAGDEQEFLARLGFFAELEPAERLAVLAARDTALAAQSAQVDELVAQMADPGSDGWRTAGTHFLRDRLARERAWLAGLVELVRGADHR
ncbi:MAG TPA: PadR family transcriptional regulator [Friedmanniella sp.]